MNMLASVFDWLLAASLRASVLTVAVFLVQWLLRHHLSPRWRHALWLPVLIVLITPVFPESPWSLGSTWCAAQEPPPEVLSVPAGQMPVMDLAGLAGTRVSAAAAPAAAAANWPHVAMLVWLAGAVLLLLGGAVSFSRVLLRFKAARLPVNDKLQTLIAQTVQEVGLRHAPRVWVSPGISSPAVAGLLRPVLLLPAEFDHAFTLAEVRLILRHELTHLKRHDLPVNALMCVLIALHWFNPVLWLAFFKVRADREAACDSQVLRNATHSGRLEYGHALLKVESAFSPLSLSLGFVGIFQRGAALRSRVRSIAVQRRTGRAGGALAVSCMLLMAFFGMTRAQQPAPAGREAPLVALELKVVELPEAAAARLEKQAAGKSSPGMPGLIVLSQQGLNTLLRELVTDPAATMISYPRVVSRADNEVVVKSVVNQPFVDAQGNKQTHPVGLVWKINPALLPGGSLRLQLDVHHSELLEPGAPLPERGPPSLRTMECQMSVDLPPTLSAAIVLRDEAPSQRQHARLYLITPAVLASAKSSPQQPPPIIARPPDGTGGAAVPASGNGSSFLANKLEKIILPSVELKDATLEEAVQLLRVQSRQHDTTTDNAKLQGVPILLRKSDRAEPKLTLSLTNVPLKQVLESIAKLAGCSFRLEPYAAVIEPPRPAAVSRAAAPAQPLPPLPSSRWVLPEVRLRDATLDESLDFLREHARRVDPAKKGVNIVVKQAPSPSSRISLDLRAVPLAEALRYVAELFQLRVAVENGAYVLVPAR